MIDGSKRLFLSTAVVVLEETESNMDPARIMLDSVSEPILALHSSVNKISFFPQCNNVPTLSSGVNRGSGLWLEYEIKILIEQLQNYC